MPRVQQPGLKPTRKLVQAYNGAPQYIVRLIARVITASLEAVKTVKTLLPLFP